jgi:hypothetical protein
MEEETVEKTNFTHSSRKAWNLLRKLGTDANSSGPPNVVTANKIASRLLKVSKAQMYIVQGSSSYNEEEKNTDFRPTNFSKAFSLEELVTALQSVKLGKAAGFDGIYSELLKNSGRRTKEWIVSFFNDILSTSRPPKRFLQSPRSPDFTENPTHDRGTNTDKVSANIKAVPNRCWHSLHTSKLVVSSVNLRLTPCLLA